MSRRASSVSRESRPYPRWQARRHRAPIRSGPVWRSGPSPDATRGGSLWFSDRTAVQMRCFRHTLAAQTFRRDAVQPTQSTPPTHLRQATPWLRGRHDQTLHLAVLGPTAEVTPERAQRRSTPSRPGLRAGRVNSPPLLLGGATKIGQLHHMLRDVVLGAHRNHRLICLAAGRGPQDSVGHTQPRRR